MGIRETELRGGEASVRAAARALDHDRYLSALLAPAPARDGLMALAAFHGEIGRIPGAVREPAIGDIRLQWWRDALATPADTATGNPVADVMRQTMREHALPATALLGMIDAYARELEPGALAAPGAIDAHVEATQGAAFGLAARVLGVPDVAKWQPLLSAAAQSYGRVQLLRSLPLLVSKDRNPFDDGDMAATVRALLTQARQQLAQARQHATAAPAIILPAILPLALVEPYLASLEDVGPDVASRRADISPVTRLWRLLKARALRRI